MPVTSMLRMVGTESRRISAEEADLKTPDPYTKYFDYGIIGNVDMIDSDDLITINI